MSNAPKVLLVVPANNTTMEPEIRALYPEVRELMVARVKRPPRTLTVEDIPVWSSIQATAWSGARVLATRGQHLSLAAA